MQLKLNELDQLVENAQQKLRREEDAKAGSDETPAIPIYTPVRLAPEAVIRIKTMAAKRQEVEKLKALLLKV